MHGAARKEPARSSQVRRTKMEWPERERERARLRAALPLFRLAAAQR